MGWTAGQTYDSHNNPVYGRNAESPYPGNPSDRTSSLESERQRYRDWASSNPTRAGEALGLAGEGAIAPAMPTEERILNDKLTKVDESYGIGDTDAAKAASNNLGGLYSKLVSSYRMDGDKNLNDGFSHALTQNRAIMANSGLNGSGVDADQQITNATELSKGRQDLNLGSNTYLDQLKDTINGQRLRLKDQVRGNGTTDLGDSSALGLQQTALNQAIHGIPGQTLGNIFTQAGQAYSQGNMAGAYGYQGNSAFGNNLGLRVNSSGGNGSGRIH